MAEPEAFITLDVFRAAAREGNAPEGAALRKGFTADSIKAEGGGQYTFTISTGAIDRDRDTIAVAGWHTDAFLKAGGPVLWAHQSRDLPIGKAPWVKAQGGALKARVEFAPAGLVPMADMVRGLVDFGALRATSVGFRPLAGKAAWNEERNGIDFMEQELLEFSIVPVPSNPEALLDAKAAGIDLAPLKGWAERVLDGMEPGLWLPRADVERAFKFAGTGLGSHDFGAGTPTILHGREAVVPESRAAEFAALHAAKEPEIWLTSREAVAAGARTLDKALDFAIEVGKRGRVLSQANEAHLRTARSAGGDLCAALDNVLQQLEAPPEGEAAAEPGPAKVVNFRKPERLPISKEDVVAATLSGVEDAVQAGLRRARGRLD